ncbi:MAG: hypothetical protein JXR46_09495 [Calditrichaceae bacterium]|nr:hypothetical protein [Calditrichaceae bacterium]MBN2709266.1 hypothetical protein [Calditrichaceae bacterium]RQV96219.1 MAG: hypothetical protein EH224_05805 [Calditrichota bacterium]
MKYFLLLFPAFGIFCLCGGNNDYPAYEETENEIEVRRLSVSAPLTDPKMEISGLTWYKNRLIILPQYPEKFESYLYYIEKNDLLNHIFNTPKQVIEPQKIHIENYEFLKKRKGYEGFEAICFHDSMVYMTSEFCNNDSCFSILISGTIDPGENTIRMDDNLVYRINAQTNLTNFSEEAIIYSDNRIITFYEVMGRNVNAKPVAHRFTPDLKALPPLQVENIEYRTTDATILDSNNHFWIINYLWPGEIPSLGIEDDPLFRKYGIGKSHSKSRAVERLLEMELTPDGIKLTDREPVLLKLMDERESRNWEGIVRLDSLGFIIATDKNPETIIGFVPYQFK